MLNECSAMDKIEDAAANLSAAGAKILEWESDEALDDAIDDCQLALGDLTLALDLLLDIRSNLKYGNVLVEAMK